MDLARTPPFALIEFAGAHGEIERRCFDDPVRIVAATRMDQVVPCLEEIQRAADAGLYAAGYVAYEAAPAFDPALAAHPSSALPLLGFGLFRGVQDPPSAAEPGDYEVSSWRPDLDRAGYDDRIARIHDAIARGETYQVNLSIRLRTRFRGDDFGYYRRLAAAQRAPYCAYVNLGRHRILSVSPELFFRRDGEAITARPMKGTAPRGRWREEDDARAAWLAGSQKNRAENLMIVDLVRNDLGRIAATGSVRTRDLFAVERYPTLFQMTSTVTARVGPEVGLPELFRALFPCGSITGAPKISTARLIAGLEESPRQAYCGAVGFVAPGRQAVFNVAIRTVLLDASTGTAEYGVGGGITWDSSPEEEYGELLTKAAVLDDPDPEFDLLETMRLEGGTYHLLDRHLTRLLDSAAYFGIPLSAEGVSAALQAHARSCPSGRWVARLLAGPDGRVRVESRPLEAVPDLPCRVALASEPVSRRNRFLFHKTTHRAVYTAQRAVRPDAFDVLLWNEEGEVTEFTIGNLVAEIGGRRYTPPRDCGLLAGTFRAALLDAGEIEERTLTPADVRAASRLWLINSVRGWVPVELEDSEG